MIIRLLFPAMFCFLFSCSPKTTQPTSGTKPPVAPPSTPPANTGTKSTCPGFAEAPNPDQATENFVLYRDFMKANDWQQAFELWQKVYAIAPAADGKRSTVFTDGVKFYERFMAQTTDSLEKEKHVREIFKLYDHMEKCYPEGGHVTALKAFDYFFKYPNRISKEEQYKLFVKSIEMDNGDPRYFILNPFTALLVDLTMEEKVPLAEAKKHEKAIRTTIEKGLKNCTGKDCDNWKTIAAYAPARLEALESVEDFYDCAYYKAKYLPAFNAAPTNCDSITQTYSRLKWGKCAETDPDFAKLEAAYNANCREETGPGPLQICNNHLKEGRYRQAASCYDDLLPSVTDNAQKAQINLIIAKIQYAYLKNYPRARQYAQAAARLRPNWGDPYILIGTLYASSGPICGPGTGWDSQVVTWPAIDAWQKAKSVDPGVAGEANRLIARYSQYMPSVEDGFQRGLKEGNSYFVGCWIQENTTMRFAK